MIDAAKILFEHPHGEIILFKNQFDLVQQMLCEPASPYYLDPGNQEEHTKAQNRLKAYISQLLSGSVTRTITEDFKAALLQVLRKKIGSDEEAEKLTRTIIQSLASKANVSGKLEKGLLSKNSFKEDFASANYISIINSKPMNVEHADQEEFSLRMFFINDMIESLLSTSLRPKFYRFNFPMESYCELFWNGLEKILYARITPWIEIEEIVDNLHDKFAIKTHTHTIYQEYDSLKNNEEVDRKALATIKDQLIHIMVDDIIEFMYQNRFILTFYVTEPIFTLPALAINPNESGPKLYLLLESEHGQGSALIKCTQENTLLWRLFVWDKLKANNTSKQISPPSMRKKNSEKATA